MYETYNYKETVNSIFVDEELAFCINIETCEYEHSQFCDPHQKHIKAGNFCIIYNSKLRKPMTRDPNYREPDTLAFD